MFVESHIEDVRDLSGRDYEFVMPSGNYWVELGPNKDVRNLSGGDCDALNSDKCVCLLSPTSGNYWESQL